MNPKNIHLMIILVAVFAIASLNTYCDSLNVDLVGKLAGGAPQRVEVVGDYAYVGSGYMFTVFDVSDKGNPVQIAYLDIEARDLRVIGDYAYIAGSWKGFSIVDVSDPVNPSEVGWCDIFGYSTGIDVVGDHAYLAANAGGLRIIDVSDPANPTEVGYCDAPDYAYEISVSSGYAYIADRWNGLSIIDVSDPTSPMEVGYFETPGVAEDVCVTGDHAYIADGVCMRIIDITDPANPTETGRYPTPGSATSICHSDTYVYVADGDRGLTIIDISDPEYPSETGSCDTSGWSRGVYLLSGYAYVADAGGGLRIIDVSDPSAPVESGFYRAPAHAEYIHVSGSYAYMTRSGLEILDISDPTNPVSVGTWTTPGSARGAWVSNSYAYVTNGEDDVRIIDVTDPANPYEPGFCTTPGFALDVHVVGDYAYVADRTWGLRILDVSGSPTAFTVGSHDGYWAVAVYTVGDYTYLADDEVGLRIFDVSDPYNPTQVGLFSTAPYGPYDVHVLEGYAYVADGGDGLWVVDVSDPANPVGVGSFSDSLFAESICVSGCYAVVGDNRMRVLDISDPSKPTEVGFFDLPGGVTDVHVVGNHIHVANRGSGLWILEYTKALIRGTIANSAGYLIQGVTVSIEKDGIPMDSTITDASGRYVFHSLDKGSTYTITPSYAHCTGFTPLEWICSDLNTDIIDADFTGVLNQWAISGTVIDSYAAPISGIAVSLSGDSTASTATDGSGYYTFSGLYAGATYTVTASRTHYTFTPSGIECPDLGADNTSADFTGTWNLWSICGTITDGGAPIQDTTVDLSGAAAASLTTSSTGYFIFSDLAAGATYSVTPSKTHYTFLPADRTYSNLGADIADSDFTCSWNYWTISGTITDSFAVLISGVTVALSGDTPAVTVTDNFGYYVFNNITAGATYTVTPSKGNLYIFNPQNAGLTDLAGDVMQDFTGSKNFAEDLENVTIYPNPWKRDSKRDIISIDNLTENVIIRIYTVSGDMVISTIPEMIAYEWDLKNDLGAPVTSGIYFCVITNDQGDKKIKKIAIIN